MIDNNKVISKILDFNLKYSGKNFWNCSILGNTINFNYEELTFCCSSTVVGKLPRICKCNKNVLDMFGKNDYINNLINLIEQNQTLEGSCRGCKHLNIMNFVPIQYDKIQINHIVYNHFKGCNARCVYCSSAPGNIKVNYESLPITKKLIEEGLVNNKTTIVFGGGEPTLLPNLSEYIEFGMQHNYKQVINTSGLIFSETILRGLQEDKLVVQISVDSGTEETYAKVKGQNGFLKVWGNISKYCKYNKNVKIKYIMFSYNSSIEEIDKFIQLCTISNVKNVVISGESAAAWQAENVSTIWNFGKQEIQACAYLMGKCLKHQIFLSLNVGNFSKENEIAITSLFIDKYLIQWINSIILNKSICIFGMGENGIKLYETLKRKGIRVECFCDNSINKQGKYYDNIRCISSNKLEKDKFIVLVAVNQYDSILKQLEDEKVNNVYVLNL